MWFHQVQSQKIIRGWNLKNGSLEGEIPCRKSARCISHANIHRFSLLSFHTPAPPGLQTGRKKRLTWCVLWCLLPSATTNKHIMNLSPWFCGSVCLPLESECCDFCVWFHVFPLLVCRHGCFPLFPSTLRLLRFSWPVVAPMSPCPHWCIVDHILRHVLMPEWNKEMLPNMLWHYHGIGIYLENI